MARWALLIVVTLLAWHSAAGAECELTLALDWANTDGPRAGEIFLATYDVATDAASKANDKRSPIEILFGSQIIADAKRHQITIKLAHDFTYAELWVAANELIQRVAKREMDRLRQTEVETLRKRLDQLWQAESQETDPQRRTVLRTAIQDLMPQLDPERRRFPLRVARITATNSPPVAQEGLPLTVTGEVDFIKAFGPPNFGETPETDLGEDYWAVSGFTPLTLKSREGEFESWLVDRAQLSLDSLPPSNRREVFSQLASARSRHRKATISGQVIVAHTAHHHEPIILVVDHFELRE